MKKLLLILLFLPMIGFGQQTYVPDDNFEQALINLGYDNVLDDSVLTASIDTLTYLNIAGQNIYNLTGIEAFTALNSLNCASNQLITLNVTNNTALNSLDCNWNNLTSLDVSNNIVLTHLDVWANQLTNIDISNNIALTYLDCIFNQLASLDVSANINLEYLAVEGNPLIISLDVSNNTALSILRFQDINLTSIDVSQNTALTELNCWGNQLTSINVSNNTALTSLQCGHNQLTSLNVSNNTALTTLGLEGNQLASLDLRNGNNTNMILSAINNPNLICIDVDDPVYSTSNWTVANGNIDPQHYFSTNCPIFGCTDSLSCNYDELATVDDSSCGYNTASYDTLSVAASIVWNGMPLNVSGDYSVTLINSVGCDSIVNLNLTVTTTGISDIANSKSNLVKITDMLGQETPYRRNTPLFYIYNDGTVEKRIVIE